MTKTTVEPWPTFQVGERVQRPENVYTGRMGLRWEGTVTRHYSDDQHDDLYEVRWDTANGRPMDTPDVRPGYLPWGLMRTASGGEPVGGEGDGGKSGG